MAIVQRWRWWRERRRHHPPDEIQRAGELAEQRLAKICRAAGKLNGWCVFESVRIPDEELGGKREIDLVIVGGNTLLVVEQKHWSGSFEINADEEFIQRRKNGTTHNHSTVFQRIQRKSRMLNAMHNNRVGKDGEVMVIVVLAFTNRNLEWPANITELDCLVKDESGLIEFLENEHPGELNDELLETVAAFGTWDEVVLNGGLVCKGDVLDLGLGNDVHRWQDGRTGELSATVFHKRSLFSLLSSAPSSLDLQHGSLHLQARLPYGTCMRMHIVGKDTPEEIPWSTISRVLLSKPTGTDNT
jgi:hypothetical protein